MTAVSLITLDDAKRQCRVEPDVYYEDSLILDYIESAHSWIERYLDRKVYLNKVPIDDKTGTAIVADKNIINGCRCLVAEFHEQREQPKFDSAISFIENYRILGV